MPQAPAVRETGADWPSAAEACVVTQRLDVSLRNCACRIHTNVILGSRYSMNTPAASMLRKRLLGTPSGPKRSPPNSTTSTSLPRYEYYNSCPYGR